jgi:hypothetical protein
MASANPARKGMKRNKENRRVKVIMDSPGIRSFQWENPSFGYAAEDSVLLYIFSETGRGRLRQAKARMHRVDALGGRC